MYGKSSHDCSFILKRTNGSHICHSREQATTSVMVASGPGLSGFVDVSELVSNGGLPLLSAVLCVTFS